MKCFASVRCIALLTLAILLSGTIQPANAQRYLTEFVGLTRVNVSRGTAVLPSSLEFDELVAGRRLAGNFSFVQQDSFGAQEEELFSLHGVVETSGKCRVQLDAPDNRGSLSLFEKNFDVDIFALVGTFAVGKDLGAVSLSRSGLIGTSAFLRPVFSGIGIPSGTRTLVLRSSKTGVVQPLAWREIVQGANNTISGLLENAGGAIAFDFVASAGSDWLYVTGVGPTSFITIKAAVAQTTGGALLSATGDYSIVDTRARTLDSGTVELSALP